MSDKSDWIEHVHKPAVAALEMTIRTERRALVEAKERIVVLADALTKIAEDRWNAEETPLGGVSAQEFARSALSAKGERDG